MRYLLAVGGNAITNDNTLDRFATAMWKLHTGDDDVIVTHGNGPQVGKLAMHENKSLAELTAETEAEIGIVLEDHMLKRYGEKAQLKHRVATVFTRVLVDAKDPAFNDPTKPIGAFYTKAESAKLVKRGFTVKKLIGGYRRVVASPLPKKILEIRRIEDLLSRNYVVIAGGGGGIAVTLRNKKFAYVDAVIDKDYTSSLLAVKLKADMLCFFTKTDGVYLDYKKKSQRKIGRIRAAKLEELLKSGVFEKGSIAPKILAAISFVKATGKIAVIGSLGKPDDVIRKKNVTVVTP